MSDPDKALPLAGVVRRNIQALIDARRTAERDKNLGEKLAIRVTRLFGSIGFAYGQVAFFVLWVLVNSGLVFGIVPFDPYPFVMLTMVASVGALLFSTLVLIGQNQMNAASEKRADLDLQISLLSEHEITRLIVLTDAIAERVGVTHARSPDFDELKQDVPPERVLDQLERADDRDKA